MPEQGIAIFSPFKVALVLAFTFLAWGDLVHGDQTALMVEALIIGLYLNDLYLKRDKIMHARRLSFSEFLQTLHRDWKQFSLKLWLHSFFDTSTKESRGRLLINLFFLAIIFAPSIMNLLLLTEVEQEAVLIAGFVLWSIWFIVSNIKAFIRTKQFGRLVFSNLGVYFLICSLLLVL